MEVIDSMGSAFTEIILHSLPFSSPTPFNEFNSELLQRQCRTPFRMTEMLIRLRQIADRLIRNETDRGIFAILDNRAVSRKYEQIILQNLPPFKRIRNLNAAEQFFRGKTTDLHNEIESRCKY